MKSRLVAVEVRALWVKMDEDEVDISLRGAYFIYLVIYFKKMVCHFSNVTSIKICHVSKKS